MSDFRETLGNDEWITQRTEVMVAYSGWTAETFQENLLEFFHKIPSDARLQFTATEALTISAFWSRYAKESGVRS